MSELLTVKDVAGILKCSEDAVVKRFAKVPGVLDLGQGETRNRRRYRVLRIPKSVLEKHLATKAGHPADDFKILVSRSRFLIDARLIVTGAFVHS
jgi:hypothetical protein